MDAVMSTQTVADMVRSMVRRGRGQESQDVFGGDFLFSADIQHPLLKRLLFSLL